MTPIGRFISCELEARVRSHRCTMLIASTILGLWETLEKKAPLLFFIVTHFHSDLRSLSIYVPKAKKLGFETCSGLHRPSAKLWTNEQLSH